MKHLSDVFIDEEPVAMNENESGDSNGKSIDKPDEFNILLGRGKIPFNHEGNQRFRGFIASYVRKYMDLNTKKQKTLLVNSVHEAILKAGGRFVEYDLTINEWVPVSLMQGRAKVGHALRDAGALRHKMAMARSKEGGRHGDQKLEFGTRINDLFETHSDLDSLLVTGDQLEPMVSTDSISNIVHFQKSQRMIMPTDNWNPSEDSQGIGDVLHSGAIHCGLDEDKSSSAAPTDTASLHWGDSFAFGDMSVQSIHTHVFDNDKPYNETLQPQCAYHTVASIDDTVKEKKSWDSPRVEFTVDTEKVKDLSTLSLDVMDDRGNAVNNEDVEGEGETMRTGHEVGILSVSSRSLRRSTFSNRLLEAAKVKPAYSVDCISNHSIITSSLMSTSDLQADPWAEKVCCPPICGRAQQVGQLRKAFEQVVASKGYCVVTVHGTSGVGKTALVETLRTTVCESRGFFCSGKFFQNSRIHEPYSAIMTAFSDLCDLVSQSNDLDEDRRKNIQTASRAEYTMLSKVIFNLSSIISCAALDEGGGSALDLKNESACNRFKVACTTFLHAMASHEHPIVLFIDDVQWMDEGSKHLLNSLLKQTDFASTMLILSYRDEEAHAIEALSLPDKSRMVDIEVGNLDSNAVHQVLSTISEPSSSAMKKLSDIVWQKTRGNPFHVHQLIDHLQRKGLLKRSRTAARVAWTFDVEEIQRQVQVSDNVADLLMQKVTKLDPRVRQVLQVASMLGFRFEARTLVGICSQSTVRRGDCVGEVVSTIPKVDSENVLSALSLAVEQGFLERTVDEYQFGHDKIQSFFQSSAGDLVRTNIHQVLGEWFLRRGDPESLCHAAKHLNQAVEMTCSSKERIKMAKINLEASKYCRDKCAFFDAADCLRQAYKALDLDSSFTHSDLAFEITESLATMELIIGNADDSAAVTRQALLHFEELNQKVKLLLIDMDRQIAINDVCHAIGTIGRALKMLSVKIPSNISIRHVLIKFHQVNTMMRSNTTTNVLSLPTVDDFLHNSILKLLFFSTTLRVVRNEVIEPLFFSLLAVELTMTRGLSPYSAPSFAMYAMCKAAFGKYDHAHTIAKMALAIADLVENEQARGATLVLSKCLVLHYFETVDSLTESFDLALMTAFRTGDVHSAAFSWSCSASARCFVGENLAQVEAFHRAAWKQARDIGLHNEFYWSMPIFQYVLNLLNDGLEWTDVVNLNGEVLSEDEYISFALKANNSSFLWQFWLLKLNLAFHFGFFELAASFASKLAKYGKSCRNHFNTYQWYYLTATVGYELYGRTGQRDHRRTARRYHKALMKLKLSPNSAPFLSFLVAEEMASKRKSNPFDVANAYVQAISTMAERKWVHMEGLANERLGFYHAGQGRQDDAKICFARAMILYRDGWGSPAKYEWLKEMSVMALDSGRQGQSTNVSHRDTSTVSSGKSSVLTRLFSWQG